MSEKISWLIALSLGVILGLLLGYYAPQFDKSIGTASNQAAGGGVVTRAPFFTVDKNLSVGGNASVAGVLKVNGSSACTVGNGLCVSGSNASNPFDQVLNTTSNVTFSQVNATTAYFNGSAVCTLSTGCGASNATGPWILNGSSVELADYNNHVGIGVAADPDINLFVDVNNATLFGTGMLFRTSMNGAFQSGAVFVNFATDGVAPTVQIEGNSNETGTHVMDISSQSITGDPTVIYAHSAAQGGGITVDSYTSKGNAYHAITTSSTSTKPTVQIDHVGGITKPGLLVNASEKVLGNLNVSNNVTLENYAGNVSKVLCLKAAGQIGLCTDLPSVTGDCTCV